MNPIDLKSLSDGRFKLALDEVALLEPGGKKDPWYQVMPCRHGQIYPYSDKLLAIHVKGYAARRKLADMAGLVQYNWSEDGEAVFLFAPALFEKVAEIVKPKRRRRLSEAQRMKLIQTGTESLQAYRKANSESANLTPKREIGGELIPEVGQSILGGF